MDFNRGKKPQPSIPTSTMGDIVFLLLIFFITTTIFRTEEGLNVNLPRAEAAKDQKAEDLAQIWVDGRGRIAINDKLVGIGDVRTIIARRMEADPSLIPSFKADGTVQYELMDALMEELKAINAGRVNFANRLEFDKKR